uniref:A-kinase anchoring protein 12 n=1 Tax=Nothoprocta perdicaria TaxID=30464 RepID=A0A8C6ZUL0_NOTPE
PRTGHSTPDVASPGLIGQTEQSSANLQEEAVTMETSPSESSTKDGLDDGKEDPEIAKKLPPLEEDAEDVDQASEPQSYDLGFKKVFKFVGFRFTVKKEKTGKSEPVQLLTVKKEMEGTEGAGDQSEASPEETPGPGDALSAEDNTKDAAKDEHAEDESPKTPEAKELSSQSAALATDTTSPLRKFFSQGWTGFRKKKSFRKPKEDELESPKKEEDQEKQEAALTAEATEKEEKSEDKSQDEEKIVAAVTVEIHEKEQTEDEKQESKKTMAAVTVEASPQGQAGIVVTDDIKPTEVTTQVSPEEAAERRPAEGITSEAELLSSQEKTKLQGSPLKKLFTGTGLKKLSGKKHKGRREESKLGEQGEQIQHLSDSPDSPEEQKAESSASSPEELNEIPSLEKPADGMQATENEDAAISDMERKRESVTPWASFKKMVTPKKRVRRPSESDKEEEIDKTKSAPMSTTENAVDENQRELKENGMDQKQEKVTEEPKRKVDTSVSWEAFICVGSSKKRARKSSSSDEETEHKVGQEGQKIEESGQSKETATDAVLTSSQESDQGQGNSSPEQAGSPSEGEGISTWESFKRLVTPRRKSKTRMEERTEDSVVGSSLEHSTSDGEPGKDESWVPFRKLMPGRRKKKSDGKPEPSLLKQAREDMTETTEEDSDVPAVVPLSEYEAAEQEKLEAQQVKDAEAKREPASEKESAEKLEEMVKAEQATEGLVHAVSVTVVEGERAVTSIEERSPSWISAAVLESIEQAEEEEEKETEQKCESEAVAEEAVVDAKTVPEVRRDTSDDTTASEPELSSEAVTALEETVEPHCAEETVEVSIAEETTEMVSAVSRLSETPDTTEEVTPVQEVEATEQNLRELARQTQEVLQEVAERVRSSEVVQLASERTVEATVTQTGQEIESERKDDGDVSSKGLEDTGAAAVAVPGTPEGEETTPALGSPDQAWTKGTPGEAPPQGEEAVQATQVPTAELPEQRETQGPALPTETTGSEAAAVSGQSVSEGPAEQVSAEDSGPVLKPKCPERPPGEVRSQSDETQCGPLQDAELKTAALSQSENTKDDKMEGAVLSTDSCGPVSAAPTQLEGEDLSALALTGMEATGEGSSVLSGSSPKGCETPRSVAAGMPAEAEKELAETSSCEDVQREESKGERLVGAPDGAGDSDTLESVSDDGSDPGAGSLEPPQGSVAAPTREPEEPVPAEPVPVTLPDPAAEAIEPLATSPRQVAAEEVPAAAVDHSGPETAELDGAEAPHPQAPPVPLKAIPEQKQEMPQEFGHPEASVAASKKSPSLDHPQLEKDIVQSVALESQSTEIVLNAIQTAVDRLAEPEETAAAESGQHAERAGGSQPGSSRVPAFLETALGNHLPVKEEETPISDEELQQPTTAKHSPLGESAEIHASVEQAKDKLLLSHAPKEGKSENSLEVMVSPQDDSGESATLPNSTVGIGTSKDSTKEPLDTHPPKLKEKELGQVLEIPDQNTVQQTQIEEKDEQHTLSVEDVKTPTPEPEGVCSQEGAPCHHPQSLNSLAPEASNVSSVSSRQLLSLSRAILSCVELMSLIFILN